MKTTTKRGRAGAREPLPPATPTPPWHRHSTHTQTQGQQRRTVPRPRSGTPRHAQSGRQPSAALEHQTATPPPRLRRPHTRRADRHRRPATTRTSQNTHNYHSQSSNDTVGANTPIRCACAERWRKNPAFAGAHSKPWHPRREAEPDTPSGKLGWAWPSV